MQAKVRIRTSRGHGSYQMREKRRERGSTDAEIKQEKWPICIDERNYKNAEIRQENEDAGIRWEKKLTKNKGSEQKSDEKKCRKNITSKIK